MTKNNKAVVLLSGGLDSGTTMALAANQGLELYALTFSYGQRHKIETKCASAVAAALAAAEHRVINIDLGKFGGSALTDTGIDVPKDSPARETDIPITYVPARNTVFLSYALAWAEVIGAFSIYIGVNAMDYSGYPDCREEFIRAFEKAANLGTRAGVEKKGYFRIHTPIINMKKSDIILTGTELGFDYSLTHSCYDPDEKGRACGRCDSCRIRLAGFEQAGLKDPIEYVTG